MDKTGIIVVSLCVLLLGWWFIEQNKVATQQAHWQQTQKEAQLKADLAAIASGSNAPATASNTIAAVNTATTAVMPAFDTSTPEQTITLTNGRARYTFTSRGGGLKLIEML